MMTTGPASLRFGNFRFDPADGRLEHLASGRAVTLRPQAGRLLQALLAAEGGVVPREALYRAVWDAGTVVDFEAGLAALVRELRQALDQLDGGSAARLETIPRRGYRLRAGSAPGPAPGAAASGRPPRRGAWMAAALALAALAATGWWLASREPAAPGDAPAQSGPAVTRALAVLPFEAYDQPAEGPRLELLLADAFLSELWRRGLDGVELIGRATLMPYGERTDVAGAVASDLGVQLLVEGSMIRAEEEWEVTARLLAMPEGRVLWSATAGMPAGPRPPVAATATTLGESLAAAWPAIRAELSSH